MANYNKNIPVYPKYSSNPQSPSGNFTSYVDSEGNIVKIDRYDGRNTIVGVDNAKYDEAIKRAEAAEKQCEEFYQKLVECGIIEAEKTPEEIQKEFMSEILNEVKGLKSEIETLKGGKTNEGKSKKPSGQVRKNSTNAKKVQGVHSDSVGRIKESE